MILDDIHKEILKHLKGDARINNKEIAEKIGVSEGTVRNRIKLLTDEGILKLTGLICPDKDSEKQLVMLGINLSNCKDLQNIAEEISRLPEVKTTGITTGRYDILVEVWVDVKYGLINFLSNSLAKVDGVVATESFIIMKSYDKWI